MKKGWQQYVWADWIYKVEEIQSQIDAWYMELVIQLLKKDKILKHTSRWLNLKQNKKFYHTFSSVPVSCIITSVKAFKQSDK